MVDDELLTTIEVAAMTRAPAATVRYWRHIGFGPAGFRLGRQVLYRRNDVRDWLERKRTAETTRSEE